MSTTKADIAEKLNTPIAIMLVGGAEIPTVKHCPTRRCSPSRISAAEFSVRHNHTPWPLQLPASQPLGLHDPGCSGRSSQGPIQTPSRNPRPLDEPWHKRVRGNRSSVAANQSCEDSLAFSPRSLWCMAQRKRSMPNNPLRGRNVLDHQV